MRTENYTINLRLIIVKIWNQSIWWYMILKYIVQMEKTNIFILNRLYNKSNEYNSKKNIIFFRKIQKFLWTYKWIMNLLNIKNISKNKRIISKNS